MKKQTKVAIGALVTGVAVIVAFALTSSPVLTGKSSGTFAKADKYHKTQMTEKDVQLRSELTSDSAKLKVTLQGLTYFAVFTEDLCLKIDTCVNVFQEQGMKSGDAGYTQLILLKDYAVFIRNSNETLGKTISMLGSFYLSDMPDQSADVEKNLREFSNYVKVFVEKDSVLESALKGMDTYILGNKILLERKDELRKLKSIRDQLLIKGIQLGAMVMDNSLCSNLIFQATNSLSGFSVDAKGDLGHASLVNSKGDLGHAIFNSKGDLGTVSLVNSKGDLGNSLFNSKDDLKAGLIYDKENLQFSAVNGLQITNLVNSQQMNAHQMNAQQVNAQQVNAQQVNAQQVNAQQMNAQQMNAVNGNNQLNVNQLIGVAIMAQDGLKVVSSNFDMQQAFGRHPICAQGGLQGTLMALTGSGSLFNAGAVMNANAVMSLNFTY
jgi:hypothetical protein